MKLTTILIGMMLFFGFHSLGQETVSTVDQILYGEHAMTMIERTTESITAIGNNLSEATNIMESDPSDTGEYNARKKLRTTYTQLGHIMNDLGYLLEIYEKAETIASKSNCKQTQTEISDAITFLSAAIYYNNSSMEQLSLFIKSGNHSGFKSFITLKRAFHTEYSFFLESLEKGYTECSIKE